ncbi:MAG: DNA methyltransferase [Eggerthella lenta]
MYLKNLEGRAPETIWFGKDVGTTRDAASEIKSLFETSVFDTPKPVGVVERALSLVKGNNYLVFDFFAGSSTTAEAVMRKNAKDGGSRMCISVQLDAECELNSVASRSGFKTICNLGEERIRRAGDKIAADIDKENMQLELGAEPKPYPDLGFRVLRIDYSNFKDFYLTPGETAQESLFDFADNVKEGRSDLDLLFEVLPKLGIPYSAKIEERMLAGRNVVAVLGFNAQTVDTAHYLTAQGKKVTIVSDEPEEAFGTGQSMMLDKFVEPVFLAAGGSVRSESKLKSVGDGEVVLTRASVSTSPFRATVWSTLRTWWPALRWPMNFPAISTLWPWVTARPR